jgi:GxxExxY protein
MIGDRGDKQPPPITDELTHAIIEAIIQVHKALGPGFLEAIYQRALVVELRNRNLPFETEVDIPILYKGEPIGRHRLDLVVAGRIIVELKTVEALSKAHYSQGALISRRPGYLWPCSSISRATKRTIAASSMFEIPIIPEYLPDPLFSGRVYSLVCAPWGRA